MWDLPGPGVKPVSPALAGGFLTTAPPGEPKTLAFILSEVSVWRILGSGVTLSDFHFDIITTLAAVGDRRMVGWARAKAGMQVRRLLV